MDYKPQSPMPSPFEDDETGARTSLPVPYSSISDLIYEGGSSRVRYTAWSSTVPGRPTYRSQQSTLQTVVDYDSLDTTQVPKRAAFSELALAHIYNAIPRVPGLVRSKSVKSIESIRDTPHYRIRKQTVSVQEQGLGFPAPTLTQADSNVFLY